MPEHDDWVEIKHPQIQKTARVSPRSVAHWARSGWKPVTSPVPATPKAAPEKKDEAN